MLIIITRFCRVLFWQGFLHWFLFTISQLIISTFINAHCCKTALGLYIFRRRNLWIKILQYFLPDSYLSLTFNADNKKYKCKTQLWILYYKYNIRHRQERTTHTHLSQKKNSCIEETTLRRKCNKTLIQQLRIESSHMTCDTQCRRIILAGAWPQGLLEIKLNVTLYFST